jgi:dihydroxyacetone kinase
MCASATIFFSKELLIVSSGSGPLFEIGKDEMELGLGVHGEAGIKKVKVYFINVKTFKCTTNLRLQ